MKTTHFKNDLIMTAVTAFLAVISSLSIATTTLYADDDRYEHGNRIFWEKGRGSGMQPMNAQYKAECGSCHFAYQPGLLPKRSWEKVMTNLADHFGTDATLEPADAAKITAYLTDYAADGGKAEYRYYQKFNRSIPKNDAPMRISEIPYFVKEHNEIPLRAIKQDAVKSLAHCQKCHATAEQGNYGEGGINIPGFGRWDD